MMTVFLDVVFKPFLNTYKESQLDAVWHYVYRQLQNCSTFFGRFLPPSSGALGTIVAASGVLHAARNKVNINKAYV